MLATIESQEESCGNQLFRGQNIISDCRQSTCPEFNSKKLIMASQTALLDYTISNDVDITTCEETIIKFFDNHLLTVAKFSEGLTLVHRHSGMLQMYELIIWTDISDRCLLQNIF